MRKIKFKHILSLGLLLIVIGFSCIIFSGGAQFHQILSASSITNNSFDLFEDNFIFNTNSKIENINITSQNEIKTLYIEADYSEINIHTSNQFSITTTGITEDQIDFIDGTDAELSIDQSAEFGINLSSNKIHRDIVLDVYVPSHIEVITIDVNLGDVEVKDLNLSQLTINSDLGDIEINGIFDSTIIEANLGDIEFSGDINDTLNIISDLGDIEIELLHIENDYNFDLSAKLGYIAIYDHNINDLNSSYVRNSDASRNIFVTTNLGSISIEKK